MARAEISPTTVTDISAVTIKIADLTVFTSDGLQFPNTKDNLVVLHNADAAPHTVTVNTAVTVNGVSITDPVITLAAGDHKIIAGFDKALLDTNGNIYLDPEGGEDEHLFHKVLRFIPV